MFPERYAVLVVGAADAGIFDFCAYLASFYLKNGQSVVIVETETSKAFLNRQLRKFGVRPEEFEDSTLSVIDCFSEPSTMDDPDHYCVPSELPELLEKIRMSAESMAEPVRIIFDSISSLNIYSEQREVEEFLSKLSDLAKKRGSLTATAHEDMHTLEQRKRMEDITNGLLEMRVDDKMRRFIRVSRMESMDVEPKWVLFDVEPASRPEGAALVWKRGEADDDDE